MVIGKATQQSFLLWSGKGCYHIKLGNVPSPMTHRLTSRSQIGSSPSNLKFEQRKLFFKKSNVPEISYKLRFLKNRRGKIQIIAIFKHVVNVRSEKSDSIP